MLIPHPEFHFHSQVNSSIYTDLAGQGICSAPSPFRGGPGWGHLAEDKVLTALVAESIIKLLYTLPISAGGGVILFSSHHSISESSDVAM